jgi:ABC-2 type transport system permease protein
VTGLASTWTLAGVTLRRALRGRTLWVAAVIALLPIGYALLLRERARLDGGELAIPREIFAFEQLVLAVLPALFVAASIGEDVEDRTATYLWSRPVPRWSILTGKLVAFVPLIWAITLASWTLAVLAGTGELPAASTQLALALGGGALAIVAAGIATLAARYAMALTICYMLFFDFPLGVMPAAIQNVSISQHGRAIAGYASDPELIAIDPVLGTAMLATVWALIGLARIRQLEA